MKHINILLIEEILVCDTRLSLPNHIATGAILKFRNKQTEIQNLNPWK